MRYAPRERKCPMPLFRAMQLSFLPPRPGQGSAKTRCADTVAPEREDALRPRSGAREGWGEGPPWRQDTLSPPPLLLDGAREPQEVRALHGPMPLPWPLAPLRLHGVCATLGDGEHVDARYGDNSPQAEGWQ
jgi:hypothetical protein